LLDANSPNFDFVVALVHAGYLSLVAPGGNDDFFHFVHYQELDDVMKVRHICDREETLRGAGIAQRGEMVVETISNNNCFQSSLYCIFVCFRWLYL